MQIHPSNEVAYRIKKHFMHIPYDHDVQINVYPLIMTTQYLIDNYRPEQRKCIDQREHHLEFFKNCRLDEFAMQVCCILDAET